MKNHEKFWQEYNKFKSKRKKIKNFFQFIGFLIGAWALFCLIWTFTLAFIAINHYDFCVPFWKIINFKQMYLSIGILGLYSSIYDLHFGEYKGMDLDDWDC